MEDKNPVSELIESYESYLKSSFEELWGSVKIEYDKLDPPYSRGR